MSLVSLFRPLVEGEPGALPLLQRQLGEVGVDLVLEGLEQAELGKRVGSGMHCLSRFIGNWSSAVVCVPCDTRALDYEIFGMSCRWVRKPAICASAPAGAGL